MEFLKYLAVFFSMVQNTRRIKLQCHGVLIYENRFAEKQDLHHSRNFIREAFKFK